MSPITAIRYSIGLKDQRMRQSWSFLSARPPALSEASRTHAMTNNWPKLAARMSKRQRSETA